MLPERLLILLGRKISGDATDAELAELRTLQQRYAEAEGLEALAASLQPSDTAFVQVEEGQEMLVKGWKTVSEQMAPPARRRLNLVPWLAAAAVLGALFWLRPVHKVKPVIVAHKNQVSTRPGSKTKIDLPDGTKVSLNAGSKLTYADGFVNGNREVTLIGEAYFEVSGEAEHPLVVNTRNMKITVLGTRFNVKAYAEDLLAEATLISGKISVTVPGKEAVILKPLQKITINQVSGKIRPDKVAEPQVEVKKVAEIAAPETAWVYNRLSFKREPFDDVIRKMERWYNIRIIVENEALHQQLMSGEFSNESIQQALTALQFTTPFRFSINKDTVMIR
jgi:ferric-dicitrate binding protein FerR (iron transport regulator)